MAATPPHSNPGDDRNLVVVDDKYLAPSFEDRLRLFWKKYSTAVLALCGLILLGILAKGGWEYLANKKDLEIGTKYATASTEDQLKSFAAAHPDHVLGGIAQLRIADDAYAAGKFADALAGYQKAVSELKDGPLAARAQLGRALSQVSVGKASEGTAELKTFVNNEKIPKGLRAEAAYHLASLASESGNSADVQSYSDQLMKIDPTSQWTQRALSLRAKLPAPSAEVSTEGKKAEAENSMQIKLPGK